MLRTDCSPGKMLRRDLVSLCAFLRPLFSVRMARQLCGLVALFATASAMYGVGSTLALKVIKEANGEPPQAT